MAANTLSDVVKSVLDGETSDEAYLRLYGSQMKPCTFRRVFAAVGRKEDTTEVSADDVNRIKGYVAEGMNVDEAFKAHCPDFVGPGEFANAFAKEMKARKAAAELKASKTSKKSQESAPAVESATK